MKKTLRIILLIACTVVLIRTYTDYLGKIYTKTDHVCIFFALMS